MEVAMRVSLRSVLSAGIVAAVLSLLGAVSALAGDPVGPFPK
jgi:hypothetical protein